MAGIYQGWQHDRNGRRYPVFVCGQGHWHRGRLQAVKCNQKARANREQMNRKGPTC